MLLTRIILNDIGVYGGKREFKLETKLDKPIVLFGGINGAGKTTLFESIPLCLYGQNYSDEKITKKQYSEKIHKLFHKYSKKRANEASITLEFQYSENGKINQYKIIRKWQNNKGSIDEFLSIEKKSERGKYTRLDIDDMQAQITINQLIPNHISRMFFFDGEKIQNIAESIDQDYLKSSFEQLLGLDIADQLHDDLGLYLLRNSDNDYTALLEELESLNEQKDKADTKLANLQEKRIFLEGEVSRKNKMLKNKEERFFKLGGKFAKDRNKLVNEKVELEKSISFNENNLRNMIRTTLPLAIVPEQLKQVRNELESDEKKIGNAFTKDIAAEIYDELTKAITKSSDFSAATKTKLRKILSDKSTSKIKSITGSKKTTFSFSIPEMAVLKKRIDSILEKQRFFTKINHNAHKVHLEKLEVINASLSVAPQQDEVGPLYSEIKSVTLEIGEMEQESQTLEKLISQEKSKIVLLNSKIRSLLAKRKSSKKSQRGIDMIPNIQDALNEYSRRLKAKKISNLKSNILQGINRCFHKELIVNLSIDPETYKITLYRKNGDVVTLDELSKGELQMYSTAIIWGLAKTSGRPLPFIIDTPLARLDAEHRENMLNSFYPKASHQTIILSTNKEVVDEYYDMLKPHLSQVALIKYDAKNDASIVANGYFKGGRKNAP